MPRVQSSSAASDRNLQTSDITTNNVSTSKHGFQPKATNAGTGAMLDSGVYGAITEARITLADNTTDDVSTSAHGFAPKLWASAWQSWSPTLANLTIGAGGTQIAQYIQIGKTVIFRYSFLLGSGSSVGTAPTITLPVTANTYYGTLNQDFPVGHIIINSGGNGCVGLFEIIDTTHFRPLAIGAAGTYLGGIVSFTASVPGTWTTGNDFSGYGVYEAA